MAFIVSSIQPNTAALGDEWHNPVENATYKLVPKDGITPTWRKFGAVGANLVLNTSYTQTNTTIDLNVGDPYWNSVSLLLDATNNTPPSTSDASTSKNDMIVFGDVKPTNMIPYAGTNYSTFFNGGVSDYLAIDTGYGQLNLPGDFTVELWFFETDTTPTIPRFAGSTSGGFACGINAYDGNATRKLDWRVTGSAPVYGVTAITTNVWHHAAYVKSGSTFRIFLDGKLEYYNGSYSTTFTSTTTYIGSANNADAAYSFRGYISNFRVVKGTAVYTTSSTTIGASIFTPSTTPLTAITGTSLLTCQSNRFIDNSLNALLFVPSGSPIIQQVTPFVATTSTTINDNYSVSFRPGEWMENTDYNTAFNFFDNSFTIEGWFYFRSLADSMMLFSLRTATNSPKVGWYTAGTGNNTANINYGYIGSSEIQFVTSSPITTGTWQHIAISQSFATHTLGTMTLYVNGVAAGSYTGNYVTNNISDQDYIFGIGDKQGQYSNPIIDAIISNVRVIKGQSLFSGNFTPSTSPLTKTTTGHSGANVASSISGTVSLLTCQKDSMIVDNGPNAFLFRYAYNGPRLINTAYPFTQTATTVDVPTTQLGSLYFDGNQDYLEIAESSDWNFGLGDFTIEFWAYATVNTRNDYICFDSGYGAGLQIYNYPTGLLYYYAFAGNRINTAYNNSYPMDLNTWNHIALVRRTGLTRLFVNGCGNGIIYTDGNDFPTQKLTIGKNYSAANYAYGNMSDLRITKGVALYTGNFVPPYKTLSRLANTKLLAFQYNGSIDSSKNVSYADDGIWNVQLTKSGNVTIGTFTPLRPNAVNAPFTTLNNGGSTYLDGTNHLYTTDYTANGAGALTSDFTAEGWFYPRSLSGTNTLFCIGTENPNRLVVQIVNGQLNTNKYGNSSVAYTGTYLTGNAWNHVAISRRGTTLYGFANGIVSSTTSTPFGTIGNGAFRIGADSGGSNRFQGYISNFRIVRDGLYTTSFTPVTKPASQTANTNLLLNFTSGGIIDYTGQADTITSNVKISNVTPKFNYAIGPFGKMNSSITIPHNTKYDLFDSTNPFTIEYWVNPSDAFTTLDKANGYVLSKDAVYGIRNPQWASRIDRNGRAILQLCDASQANILEVGTLSTVFLNIGSWSHVAHTRDNSNVISTYVNGVLTERATCNITLAGNSGNLVIGTLSGYREDVTNAPGVAPGFIGYLEGVRITKGVNRYTSNTFITANTFIPPTQFKTFLGNFNTPYSSNVVSITVTQVSPPVPPVPPAAPLPPLSSVEVLMVAGGGGATGGIGGGGGGGGVIMMPAVAITPGSTYTIIVGGGGAGTTYPSTYGGNGSNTTVFGAQATGGGGTGAHDTSDGNAGGSGGGASSNNTRINTGGAGQLGMTLGSNSGTMYGNRGGNLTTTRNSTPTLGAGGGGAGGQGIDTDPNFTGTPSPTSSAAGGGGIQSSILGTPYYFGGGGGGGGFNTALGGNGGIGGGGAGAGDGGPGTSGGSAINPGTTAGPGNSPGGSGGQNTGGGGGSAGWVYTTGGSGGSGIVVIRHPSGYSQSTVSPGANTVVSSSGGYVTYRFNGSGTITFNS